MKWFLLVALLMAGCVLTAAKIDKPIHFQPITPSANPNPSKPVIVEVKPTRQASLLEPPILTPGTGIRPTESETPKQNPQKNKLTKETKTSTENKPARKEPTKLTAEVLAKPADVPVKPEEVHARPEDVPIKPEEAPVKPENVPAKSAEVYVKPEEILVKPEVVPAKPVTPEMTVENEVHDDNEVPVRQPFGQKPSKSTTYRLSEGVTLSPRHGDSPEYFTRDDLVIPGGSAGISNEQSGDVAELSVVYTAENNLDEDPNITRAHEALMGSRCQRVASGYSEDQATCPAPKTAK